jgi:putative hydrolase of the HAD superfamily
MAAIETLLFDFGGTLDADGVAWKERFYALYRAEGVGVTAEAFAPAYYAADDPLVGALAISAGLEETVHALTGNLDGELERRGAAPGEGRGKRVAARFLHDTSAIFARNRSILEALSGRYRLGIVSNFYGNLEAVCRSAGLAALFPAMIDSVRVGAEKPDPAIFRSALEALGAAPETTLFVGDSLRRDCEGARRASLRFVWIAPKEDRAGAASASGPILATIAKLPELVDVLA